MPKKELVTVEIVGGKVVKRTGPPPTAIVLDDDSDRIRRALNALVPALTPKVDALTIETEEDYLAADAMFGQIAEKQKVWGVVMEEIIRPIRKGLDRLYLLNRTVDAPLAQLRDALAAKMKDYKRKELARVAGEQAQVEQERQRLLREQEKAKSPLKQQAVAMQLEEIETFTPETVRGSHSSARPTRKVRVTSIREFAAAVGSGLIPEDCLMVAMPRLNAYYKDDTETVEGWPGVEGFDDVTLVSR